MHTRRVWLPAVLALTIIGSATSAARQGPQQEARTRPQDRHAQRAQRANENRFTVPVADGRRELREIRSSSRSVSILDDRRRRGTVQRAGSTASPGMFICEDGTAYDFQHNDLGQKQIVTLGGDPNVTNVHFTWTHWDIIPESLERVDRFHNYNGFNPLTGLCLGDCGVTISGAGGDPTLARAGFSNIDVMSDGNASMFFHQFNEVQQSHGSDGTYSAWILDEGIPCFNLFLDTELSGSLNAEAIWTHGATDRMGAPGPIDVFHVTAHPTGNIPPFANEIHYWRRIARGGVWTGPVVLDNDAGQLNHYVSADPTSEKVAVVYTQDQIPGYPDDLLQVVYMESSTNGADWIADGAGSYPTPLTSLGHAFVQVTNYADPNGPQSWLEAGGEYDLDGELHVFWVEQVTANISSDCRLRHWTNANGFSTVAQAIGWHDQGFDGARDLWLAYPGLAFGDGQTVCPGGAQSNRNYVYYLYEQYGGPTAVEAADVSAAGHQNLEVYLSASSDGGATWSPPANLTNTKTPGCDGTLGNECASERDPSMARVVNDAIHIQYILDIDAGDAVFGQGNWTFNPVMYYKIQSGADAGLICPGIAASLAARLTNSDPDCEYNATFSPPGMQTENLIVENFGNAMMIGSIGENPDADWLTITPSGAYSIPPGGSQISTVTMDAGAASIQLGGEGLYQTSIYITHDDSARASPQVIPVDFFVFDEFYCPEHLTFHTGGNGEGTLWLTISNVERFGDLIGTGGGLSRNDPIDGDSSWSIYDGSLIIGVPPDPDTLVYRNLYGAGNGQPGFRALSNLAVDTSAYGANAGEVTALAYQTTIDSIIGIDIEYAFPQHPDSAEFVLIKYAVYNRTESTISGATVGAAVDFDVTPSPDVAGVQPGPGGGDELGYVTIGPQNTGHLRPDYNMIYQQGVDSTGHVIVGDNTATRFKGGMTAIRCDVAPRAWIGPSDPLLYNSPGGGWSEGYLYREMTRTGFELLPPDDPDPEEDLHAAIVFEQEFDLAPTEVKHYILGLVSSNTGTDETDMIETTRKAWKHAFGWQTIVTSAVVPENTPASYPYYASGSHEDGLGGGCCGCVVTEVSDPMDVFSIGGGGGCEGTIEFAGGNACVSPYTAVFRVQDLCGDYRDDCVVTIAISDPCACSCPHPCDFDEDNFLTALDLGVLIDVLFGGRPDVQDSQCPTARGDFDCDCFTTALDLAGLIDHLFAGQPGPCDPCNHPPGSGPIVCP